MAKLIISFDEFGGIGDFNGISVNKAEPLIINKAVDYLLDNGGLTLPIENRINYRKSAVDFILRQVSFHLEI